MSRKDLEDRWFDLTRKQMPDLATVRGWPVRFDHCFQRILLDNAVGAKWRDVIDAPAYRNASDAVLERAIALAEAVISGEADLVHLNNHSLAFRGKL